MNTNKSKFTLIYVLSALIFIGLLINCASERRYDFSLKNTLAIFLVNNEGEYAFCIPVQYMGDYHIGAFNYTSGSVTIGEYEIELNRNEINIHIFLSESADEQGSSVSGFNQIYTEEKGNILLSMMNEPLTVKERSNDEINHYYIFIERHLSKDELTNIIKEYEKGNINSRMNIWYDINLDNEPQNGSGLLDDFELYNGEWIDPVFFPPNLNFYKEKYLKN